MTYQKSLEKWDNDNCPVLLNIQQLCCADKVNSFTSVIILYTMMVALLVQLFFLLIKPCPMMSDYNNYTRLSFITTHKVTH